tara:strand:- start:1833 stop:2285 length:453 start_codon:yes stop_codon:yes gene_type:complete
LYDLIMENKEGINLIKVTAVIVGSVIVLGLGWKISKFLGIIPDFSDDRLLKQKELTPQFYIDNPNLKTISGSQALQLVNDFYNSSSWYNDREEMFVGAIQQAGSKANLSFVAYLYYAEHKMGLAKFLDEITNASEKKEIIKAANRLPNKV